MKRFALVGIACLLAAPIFGQAVPGSPFTGGSGGAGVTWPLISAIDGTGINPAFQRSTTQGMWFNGTQAASTAQTGVVGGDVFMVLNGNTDTIEFTSGGFTFTLKSIGGIPAIAQLSGSLDMNANWLQNVQGEVALNADYTNATTTFSNTALSVTLITGQVLNFTANLLVTDSIAADGIKLDFNGGVATTSNFAAHCVLTNSVGTATTQANAITAALATVINATAMTDTAQHLYVCTGTFVASGNGTFIIRAAQNAHSTGTLTIKRGSWLSMKPARAL